MWKDRLLAFALLMSPGGFIVGVLIMTFGLDCIQQRRMTPNVKVKEVELANRFLLRKAFKLNDGRRGVFCILSKKMDADYVVWEAALNRVVRFWNDDLDKGAQHKSWRLASGMYQDVCDTVLDKPQKLLSVTIIDADGSEVVYTR